MSARFATTSILLLAALAGIVLTLLSIRATPAMHRVVGPFPVPQVEPELAPLPPPALRGYRTQPRKPGPSDPSKRRGVTVRVHDTADKPIAGAKVQLLAVHASKLDVDTYPSDQALAEGVSDAEGKATLEFDVSTTRVMFLATAESFKPGTVPLVDDAQGTVTDLTLEAAREIRGVARLPSGAPVSGVRVVCISEAASPDAPERALLPLGRSWWCDATSDEHGRFVLRSVAGGEHTVRAGTPGWDTVRYSEAASPDSVAELVIRPVRLIRFMPIDEGTRTPITLQGLGWQPEHDDLVATRAGAFVGATVFTPQGKLETWKGDDPSIIVQPLYFDRVPTTSTVNITLFWLTSDPVYLPARVSLRLRVPGEEPAGDSLEKVPLKLRDPSRWGGAVRLREEAEGASHVPSGPNRILVFTSSSGGDFVQAARGVRLDDYWLYAPVPSGTIQGTVHAGNERTSAEVTLEIPKGQTAEATIRFPQPTGFTLETVDEDGRPLPSVDDAFYTRIQAIGGTEVSQRDRVYISQDLSGLAAGEAATFGSLQAGYHRIFVQRGGQTATRDIEVEAGELVQVRMVVSRRRRN